MANVKKESTSNGGGMVSGIIIVACICWMVDMEFHHG
jgi:hypothetical protein